MNTEEFINYVREIADDAVEPYLVSDESLLAYLGEAEREAFSRAYLAKTDESFDLPVTAGKASYELDELIFQVERLKLLSSNRPLIKTTKRELDFNINDWSLEAGKPKWFYQEGKVITLYPIPESSDKLMVDAWRYPDGQLETPEEHHEDLAYWVLYRYYSVNDADANNIQLSGFNLAQFSNAFGHKRSAQHGVNMQNISASSSMAINPFN